MNHIQLINYLIRQRGATQFLQLGIIEGQQGFDQIECAHKTGIDTGCITNLPGRNDEAPCLNRNLFDVIFIDSFHTEEQTVKEIAWSLQSLSKSGIIVLHDCMPPDRWHQREPELFHDGENWNGTVWKAVLKVFNNSNYKCFLLDMDWGCGLIDTAQNQFPRCLSLPEELDYDLHYRYLLEYKISIAAYLRENMSVFYHLACMGNWHAVFEEQLRQLHKNGFSQLNLTVLGTDNDLTEVNELCIKMKIIPNTLYHSSELINFEKPAMLEIEKYAQKNEGFVFYLHSKGVSNPDNKVKTKWRRLMMKALVEDWENCIPQLTEYDAVGVNWREMPPISHFCGNFWYASTYYLRKLADFECYYENPRYHFWDSINDKRLGCEFWIGSSPVRPRIYSLLYNNVDFCSAEFWKNK